MSVDISFIVTVFNKEKYLKATINSILRQVGDLNCEYIFIDDASSDNSIKVIEGIFQKLENFTILINEKNMGPSISLNRGCKAASGRYLMLIDADDILIQNALDIMLNAIKVENADFVFGGHENIPRTQDSLLSISIPIDRKSNYAVSSSPLDTVLKGRYVRMSYLITKELYLKSNGAADSRIFIQDESLPLRLAYSAKKMITLNNIAVYAVQKDDSLSQNKLQQIHDRFYAYYFALLEFENLTNFQKSEIYKRAVSCVWKAKKMSKSIIQKLFFISYLKTKLLPCSVGIKNLDQYRNFIDSLQNVRKTH